MTRCPSIAALLLAVLASPASARPVLPGDGLARLDRYDVLTFTDPAGDGMRKGKAIGVFDAMPDEIFRVLTEYERYPEFTPQVVATQVVDRQGDDRALVSLATRFPWPVRDAWVLAQFEHQQRGDGTYRIRFWQVRGTMRRYAGDVLIEPWSSSRSSVTYELLAEPHARLSRRYINNRISDAAGRYVHALRQRVNELHRAGLLHPLAPPNPSLVSPLTGPRAPLDAKRNAQIAKAR